jgi:hypothetical protein
MVIQPLARRNHTATLTAARAAPRSTLGTCRSDSPNTAPSGSTSARAGPRMIISMSWQPCRLWRGPRTLRDRRSGRFWRTYLLPHLPLAQICSSSTSREKL